MSQLEILKEADVFEGKKIVRKVIKYTTNVSITVNNPEDIERFFIEIESQSKL